MAGAGSKGSSAKSELDIFDASTFKLSHNGKKLGKKHLKNVPIRRRTVNTNGVKKHASTPAIRIAVNPDLDDETKENLNIESQGPSDMEVCKHCKKAVMKHTAKDHIAGCLKSKQEKARKKKEAREAAQRAKERAERGDEDEDEDDDTKGVKKRKTEGDDEKDTKKKKKKEEQKAKTAKPKGPVDVERQCGVALPNGAQCARSLTCKSHSMGAKRAVPGRSLPYDMLLQAYQKKNQARQQKAAIDANAPLLFDDDLDPALAGSVDSDEERDSIMTSISRSLSRPQPIITQTIFPTRRKYQLVRMKEMLSNALSGNRSGGLFGVPPDSARSAYPPPSAISDYAIQSAVAISATGSTPSTMKAPPRKQSIDTT